MSSTESDHPIRKSLKRKLTNGDPFDNYGGFDSYDASPVYTLAFHDESDCTYFLKFLEGQFFTSYSGQSVTVKFYLDENVVKTEVCPFLSVRYLFVKDMVIYNFTPYIAGN